MKHLFLAITLLLASCADIPDQPGGLSVSDQAVQAFAWPDTLWTAPLLEVWSPYTWHTSPVAFARVSQTTTAASYAYYGGTTGPSITASSSASFCSPVSGTDHFWCDGAYAYCPPLDYRGDPQMYYFVAGVAGYPMGWTNWTNPEPWVVTYGANSLYGTASQAQGGANAWTLVCQYPPPAANLTLGRAP